MTPTQAIKYMILAVDARWSKTDLPADLNGEQVDERYAELVGRGAHWDARSEVREGQCETGIECEWSRHYESKSVASKAPNGKWVGWTYWYGGGKHGEPEAIDWMEDAYFLECVEEQKVLTVRTFAKA